MTDPCLEGPRVVGSGTPTFSSLRPWLMAQGVPDLGGRGVPTSTPKDNLRQSPPPPRDRRAWSRERSSLGWKTGVDLWRRMSLGGWRVGDRRSPVS